MLELKSIPKPFIVSTQNQKMYYASKKKGDLIISDDIIRVTKMPDWISLKKKKKRTRTIVQLIIKKDS